MWVSGLAGCNMRGVAFHLLWPCSRAGTRTFTVGPLTTSLRFTEAPSNSRLKSHVHLEHFKKKKRKRNTGAAKQTLLVQIIDVWVQPAPTGHLSSVSWKAFQLNDDALAGWTQVRHRFIKSPFVLSLSVLQPDEPYRLFIHPTSSFRKFVWH